MRLSERLNRLQRRIDELAPRPRVICVCWFEGGPSPPEDTELYPGAYERRQSNLDPTPIPRGAKVYLFDAGARM